MSASTALVDGTEVRADGRIGVERSRHAEGRASAGIQTSRECVDSLSLGIDTERSTVVVEALLNQEVNAVSSGLV